MKSDEDKIRTDLTVTARIGRELPALVPALTWQHVRRETKPGKFGSANLTVEARHGVTSRTLLFDVKSIGEPRMAAQAITRLKTLQRSHPRAYLVFAAPYVSERSRQLCRMNGVGYVDLLGNAYLEFGPVLIDRETKASAPVERRSLRSILAPKATRVLRALLEAPDRPTRITDLAATCSMSPAGVYFVVERLETKGFVQRGTGREIRLTEPRRLLLEWAQNWSVERNGVQRYFSFEKGPERLMTATAEAAKVNGVTHAFTGMAGASKVAPFVRYDEVWCYVGSDHEKLVQALDLRPVSSGANLVLLDPYDPGVFLGTREIDGLPIVSNIQLFVDLYTYPARGQEQAEQLLQKAIRFPETP